MTESTVAGVARSLPSTGAIDMRSMTAAGPIDIDQGIPKPMVAGSASGLQLWMPATTPCAFARSKPAMRDAAPDSPSDCGDQYPPTEGGK